jgi:hypothetical protein
MGLRSNGNTIPTMQQHNKDVVLVLSPSIVDELHDCKLPDLTVIDKRKHAYAD